MGCQTSFAQLPCMPSRGCPSRGLLRPRAFFNRSSVASATTAQAPISLELQKQVSFGESIKVVGSSAALGNWNVDQAPSLTWSEGDVWKITLDFEPGSPAEFKFVVVSGGSTVWEDGGNRTYEAKSQKPARLSCNWGVTEVLQELPAPSAGPTGTPFAAAAAAANARSTSPSRKGRAIGRDNELSVDDEAREVRMQMSSIAEKLQQLRKDVAKTEGNATVKPSPTAAAAASNAAYNNNTSSPAIGRNDVEDDEFASGTRILRADIKIKPSGDATGASNDLAEGLESASSPAFGTMIAWIMQGAAMILLGAYFVRHANDATPLSIPFENAVKALSSHDAVKALGSNDAVKALGAHAETVATAVKSLKK